ncbi:MAG: hypothetical protein WKF63_00705 [Thermomicrobiales bacterium]
MRQLSHDTFEPERFGLARIAPPEVMFNHTAFEPVERIEGKPFKVLQNERAFG